MDQINWLQLGIGLISGGAFGAIIKQIFDSRKNRIQPIEFEINTNSLYVSFDNKLLDSEVLLKDATGEYKFSRLFTGSLRVRNIGSLDFAEFAFGLTLPDDAKFVQVKVNSIDRHHIAEPTPKPALNNQVNTFDFKLKPFNRKDEYRFDFLIMTTVTSIEKSHITISSAHAIKWVSMSINTDLVFDIAKNVLLKIGPVSIGLDRR